MNLLWLSTSFSSFSLNTSWLPVWHKSDKIFQKAATKCLEPDKFKNGWQSNWHYQSGKVYKVIRKALRLQWIMMRAIFHKMRKQETVVNFAGRASPQKLHHKHSNYSSRRSQRNSGHQLQCCWPPSPQLSQVPKKQNEWSVEGPIWIWLKCSGINFRRLFKLENLQLWLNYDNFAMMSGPPKINFPLPQCCKTLTWSYRKHLILTVAAEGAPNRY